MEQCVPGSRVFEKAKCAEKQSVLAREQNVSRSRVFLGANCVERQSVTGSMMC
jgi:hypothetical protein